MCGIIDLGDADVVVEHLGFGGTRRRVQHLVRVGELHPAVSIHHLTLLPAVPLNYDEDVRGVPARGGAADRRHRNAAADPADLVPYCSGDQTPMDDNCRPMSHQVFTHDAPGADPDVPLGITPGEDPVVGGGG